MFSKLTTLIIILISFAVTSCTTLDDPENDVEQLPWNTPAGWEGQTMGLPY